MSFKKVSLVFCLSFFGYTLLLSQTFEVSQVFGITTGAISKSLNDDLATYSIQFTYSHGSDFEFNYQLFDSKFRIYSGLGFQSLGFVQKVYENRMTEFGGEIVNFFVYDINDIKGEVDFYYMKIGLLRRFSLNTDKLYCDLKIGLSARRYSTNEITSNQNVWRKEHQESHIYQKYNMSIGGFNSFTVHGGIKLGGKITKCLDWNFSLLYSGFLKLDYFFKSEQLDVRYNSLTDNYDIYHNHYSIGEVNNPLRLTTSILNVKLGVGYSF